MASQGGAGCQKQREGQCARGDARPNGSQDGRNLQCALNEKTLVQRFTQRMDLRERSGVTCVNLHFRSVGVTSAKSLLFATRPTGVKRAKKWLR